eukprot:CAMPEP_0197246910 /NCGR_PEP_ID=MMETSP1429-20130617/23533_1 /TAXON_ID=49237 /ORGANISM="Chaetoceros  sp., Strain UNC1202" /LENGTH=288 /DNA_ID=CAMNT_0042707683 /DNA_START=42 /DNA_END=908 /DNA_ORIENTATION=-
MVEISEVAETPEIPASEVRFLDAKEIEEMIEQAKRPSVKIHLQALVQKIKRDGNALKRLEESKKKHTEGNDDAATSIPVSDPGPTPTSDSTEPSKNPSAPSPPAAATTMAPAPISSTLKYIRIDRFSFDAGSYNSPTVSVYISLPGIGSIPNKKEQISCTFTSASFDLTIHDFNGKNYRLLKDNLDKDIDPDKSKYLVKPNKIIIKLQKVKSEYGSYDSWTDLTAKKTKQSKSKASSDPSASIMELMKDMYDDGDDSMKKMIGETMMKQRQGNLDGMESGMDDLNMDM